MGTDATETTQERQEPLPDLFNSSNRADQRQVRSLGDIPINIPVFPFERLSANLISNNVANCSMVDHYSFTPAFAVGDPEFEVGPGKQCASLDNSVAKGNRDCQLHQGIT